MTEKRDQISSALRHLRSEKSVEVKGRSIILPADFRDALTNWRQDSWICAPEPDEGAPEHLRLMVEELFYGSVRFAIEPGLTEKGELRLAVEDIDKERWILKSHKNRCRLKAMEWWLEARPDHPNRPNYGPPSTAKPEPQSIQQTKIFDLFFEKVSPDQLIETIQKVDYTRANIGMIAEFLNEPPTKFIGLKHFSEPLLKAIGKHWDPKSKTIGFLVTILTSNHHIKEFQIAQAFTEKLAKEYKSILANKSLRKECVSVIDPLSFALAVNGFPVCEKIFQEALLTDAEFSIAASNRSFIEYFGGHIQGVRAVNFHSNDSRRSDSNKPSIIAAHDAGLIIGYIQQFGWDSLPTGTQSLLLEALQSCYGALWKCEQDLCLRIDNILKLKRMPRLLVTSSK